MTDIEIEPIIDIAKQAGAAIMEVYDSDDIGLSYKEDEVSSPLTRADLAAHEVIEEALTKLTPEIPVVSEESENPSDDRLKHKTIWLVDPLDGTKEFAKRNGQFTVNIALIEDGAPVLGVIYAPAIDTLYWGDEEGAFKRVGEAEPESIKVRDQGDKLTAVASATHNRPEIDDWLAKHEIDNTISIGSSLKLCYVADGQADVYPRLAPTMEWDTAAGDAIVIAAGGIVLDYPDKQPLVYNKPDQYNPHFIAASSRQIV